MRPTSRISSLPIQFFICISSVIITAFGCYFLSSIAGYKVVALILLMQVSILAIIFDILPVLVASILSALVWNYFFIPPLFTFHINSAEDFLLFLMYFIIALVNATLTNKIRQIEKVARTREEKEEAIKLYNTLLNSLSHEMRTPLATLIAATDTLRENNNLSSENKIELFSAIDNAGERLNRNVENLLNMSRLESGMLQLKKDWTDINELIFTVIQKYALSSGSRIIEFIPDDTLPLFYLDSGLVETIIRNIVDNAIQYTSENSRINIRASYDETNCIITISDNGFGFPESEIPNAFGKFYRLPHSKTGGTGLGLSISKGFAEAHNGTIILKNNPDGGAAFTIILPAPVSFISNLKNE